MSRISRQEMFMRMAETTAMRSTCLRAQVGCVITNAEETVVVALGYNGPPRGFENFCEGPQEPGKCGCIHAEANALIKAPYREGPLALYCTHAPCDGCAKMIVNSAVRCVYFRSEYRQTDGVTRLRHAGIHVIALPTS